MARSSGLGLSIVHGPAHPRPIDKTFGCLLREQAKQRPYSLLVASDHQNKSLTYAQANNRSDQLAKGLAYLGVKKGDRVAILMGNDIEYVEVFFACTKLGAPIALVNYSYTEQELHSALSSCGASVLFMVSSFDKTDYTKWLPRLKQGIPSIRHIIIPNGDQLRGDHHLRYEDVMENGRSHELDLIALEKKSTSRDIMNLQFTSGSTGMPKASALTHFGIFNTGRFIGDTMYLKPSDRICLPVPLFHSFGLIIGLATVAVHGASIILPDYKFNMEATLACIPKYKCTGLYGVTTMFVGEMSHPNFKKYDYSSLRFAILAGSAVPEVLARQVWAAFGITQTHTNWGLTESSSICTMTRDTDNMYQRTVTSGSLFPGYSARIVDPTTGRSIRRGQKGEITLRGFGIQQEYYANPQKTAEAHRISPEDGLEWFFTGDEGHVDNDGYFVITGRTKDMIIRGGENISPLEIEERLVAHPAIAQSAVIGVPDEKYGEQICAFVERAPNAIAVAPSDNDIREWVRQALAHFKAPKYVVWLGSHPKFKEWPKTGSGKLRKPDLRKLAPRILKLQPERPKL
ncbi:hypothetical protein F4808DRAFT_458926 [Astrocystis sublimbata]|nr:hypothetical protein F4808DRAFT_458926 [Astrocystis sublimbata]